MTQPDTAPVVNHRLPLATILRRAAIGLVVTAGIIWYVLSRAQYGGQMMDSLRHVHPHGPDLALLGHQPLVILIHLSVAILAFAVGLFQLVAPKGTIPHRIIGWAWLIFMTVIAVSSLFIRNINHGHFSFIHILSAITLIQIPVIIYLARTHQIQKHGAAAYGLFMGALLIAGLLTFIPGRLMWQVFFG